MCNYGQRKKNLVHAIVEKSPILYPMLVQGSALLQSSQLELGLEAQHEAFRDATISIEGLELDAIHYPTHPYTSHILVPIIYNLRLFVAESNFNVELLIHCTVLSYL